MKTLQNIKDDYAQEQGYEDWDSYVVKHFMLSTYSIATALSIFENHMDEVCLRAQKAALEKAAENAYIHYPASNNFNSCVDETTITNENNLIL